MEFCANTEVTTTASARTRQVKAIVTEVLGTSTRGSNVETPQATQRKWLRDIETEKGFDLHGYIAIVWPALTWTLHEESQNSQLRRCHDRVSHFQVDSCKLVAPNQVLPRIAILLTGRVVSAEIPHLASSGAQSQLPNPTGIQDSNSHPSATQNASSYVSLTMRSRSFCISRDLPSREIAVVALPVRAGRALCSTWCS